MFIWTLNQHMNAIGSFQHILFSTFSPSIFVAGICFFFFLSLCVRVYVCVSVLVFITHGRLLTVIAYKCIQWAFVYVHILFTTKQVCTCTHEHTYAQEQGTSVLTTWNLCMNIEHTVHSMHTHVHLLAPLAAAALNDCTFHRMPINNLFLPFCHSFISIEQWCYSLWINVINIVIVYTKWLTKGNWLIQPYIRCDCHL